MTSKAKLSRLISIVVLSCLLATMATPARGDPRPPITPPDQSVFTLPITTQTKVIHPFDEPEKPWLPGHRGVDLVAEPGSIVLAPADGTVTFSGNVAGRWVLTITHDHGLRSSFETVEALTPVGSRVTRGEQVGLAAQAPEQYRHCYPESCLHWGVRRGEKYLDPMSLLNDRPPIVLLPWGG